MNHFKRTTGCLKVAGTVALGAATLISIGCSQSEVDALLAGVEVVAGQLTEDENSDLNFGDWLAAELSD